MRGPATEGGNRGTIGRSGFVVRVRAPDDVVRGCCMARSEMGFGGRRPWVGRSSYCRWCRFGRRRWGGHGGVVVGDDHSIIAVGDECEVLGSVGGGRGVLGSVGDLLGLSECFSGKSLRGGQNDVTGLGRLVPRLLTLLILRCCSRLPPRVPLYLFFFAISSTGSGGGSGGVGGGSGSVGDGGGGGDGVGAGSDSVRCGSGCVGGGSGCVGGGSSGVGGGSGGVGGGSVGLGGSDSGGGGGRMSKTGRETARARRGAVEETGTRSQSSVAPSNERRCGAHVEGWRTVHNDLTGDAGESSDHDELGCCRSRVSATQEKKGTETVTQIIQM